MSSPTHNQRLEMIRERYGLSREDILRHQAEYLRRRDELRRQNGIATTPKNQR